ncbi:hypothetical protein D3C76_741890 [compost metagenome]
MHGFHVVAAGFRAERHAAIEPGSYHRLTPGVQVAAKAGGDFQRQFDFRALQALVHFAGIADGRLFGEIA